MIRKTFFLTILLIFYLTSFGQNYKSALGMRLAPFSGFTAKHFINTKNAVEGLITVNQDGFLMTGLFEYQQPTTNVYGLDWFIGGGGHVGYLKSNYGNWNLNGDEVNHNRDFDAILGVDFIAGFEYTFETVPFTVGIDCKPAINFFSHSPFLFDVGLTFRYNFN